MTITSADAIGDDLEGVGRGEADLYVGVDIGGLGRDAGNSFATHTDNNDHVKPFVLTLVLIFLGYSGLGISLWPNIIPPSVSIWDAAAPPQSQGFMLVGTLFIIPFILGYTFWSYYVFRGKVTHEDGYH